MAKEALKFLKKIRRKFSEYLSTNRLFLSFVVLTLIETIIIRNFTVGNTWDYKPFIVDLALIMLIGSFGYLFKPKNQFKYFFTWLVIITLICIINSVYYTFYLSFTSFGLLASLGQVGEVTDSLVEKFRLADFVYVVLPLVFFYVHRLLNRTNYYNYVSKVERGKKMCIATSLVGVILIAVTMVSMTATDYSRISKQWNREYIVERFGIILYQGNDLVQSLTPRISSLFGYDEAARGYREFYAEKATETVSPNKYTNILKDMNVVFVHMESMQTFLMDLSFNDGEVTPNLNRLATEGLFFSNFYAQISTGTSSDTEFTLLSSLMPSLSGTVFVSYYNREYLTIPKMLKEEGYYIYSMHGNKADMWNRAKAHASLGYDKFYSSTSFITTPENKVGRLGIGDSAFFEQALPIMIEIEKNNPKYMGTIITLSNHSPFDAIDKYGEFDLTHTANRLNEKTGLMETVIDPYLEGTKMGNYIHSAHYADTALGEFMGYVEDSEYFNNTIFVFYGDHDAKLARSEFNFLYNYNPETGEMLDVKDPSYVDYESYLYDLSKNTPLVFWTKNDAVQRKLKASIDYPMGMYDILPTLGNMMGFNSSYALGHDIFDKKQDNIVIFPNGNFLTDKVYYSNSSETYVPLKEGIILDKDYIEERKLYTEKRLTVSYNIIIYDLIKKESEKANFEEEVAE